MNTETLPKYLCGFPREKEEGKTMEESASGNSGNNGRKKAGGLCMGRDF